MSDEHTPAADAAKEVRKKAAAKKNEVADAMNTAADNAADAVNDASDKVADTIDSFTPDKPVGDTIADAAEATSDHVADAADTAKSKGAAALSAATSKVSAMMPDDLGVKAKGVASDVKDKASDAVEGLAKMIHDSAGAIDDNVGPKYGDYARSAAQSVTDAADRLRAKPVDEIAADTKEFVRTKPGTALGIAAVTSLVLVRILGAVFGKRR